MSTTSNKSDARRIMDAAPGMKYTEALRHANRGLVPMARRAVTAGDHPGLDAAIRSLTAHPATTPTDPTRTERPHLLCITGSHAGSRPGKSWMTDLARNTLVTGPTGSGATWFLFNYAHVALLAGWDVLVISAKSTEYEQVRDTAAAHGAPGHMDVIYAPTVSAYADAVRSIDTTRTTPLVVILDGGFDAQTAGERPAITTEGWKSNLRQLLVAPFTIVWARTRTATPANLGPAWTLLPQFTERIHMGPVASPHHEALFGCEPGDANDALTRAHARFGGALVQDRTGEAPLAMWFPSWEQVKNGAVVQVVTGVSPGVPRDAPEDGEDRSV